MQTILNVLMLSTIEIVYLFGILIAVGFILGWIEAVSNRWAYQALGRVGVMLTSWIGTPIHEAGHIIMCFVFRHKINAIKLFTIDPKSATLGFVKHSYNKKSIYQRIGNFFISLGPIFSGTAAILFFMYMLEPKTFKVLQTYVMSAPIDSSNLFDFIRWSSHAIWIVLGGLVNSGTIGSLNFWIFLGLAICTASHIALSKADRRDAVSGLFVTFLVLLLINFGLSLFGIGTMKYVLIIAKYSIYPVSVLFVSIAFSLVTAFVMGILSRIKRLIRS